MPFPHATKQLEMTLSVMSPCFDKFPPCRVITVNSGQALHDDTWTITLTRNLAELIVSLRCGRSNMSEKKFIKFRSLFIVPRSDFFKTIKASLLDGEFYSSSSTQVRFPADAVLFDDKYDFEIILSTEHEMSRSFATIVPLSAPALAPVPKQRELLPLLLKDPSSVDICFTFSSDKTYSNIGLWAHCVLLSQYEYFVKLIQDAKMVQSLGRIVLVGKGTNGDADVDSDSHSISNFSVDSMDTATGPAPATSSIATASRVPLVIKLDAISLATFCVMLYFIYTGEVDRTVDTNRFVLSNTNRASLVWRDDTGKIEDSIDWRPLDEDSPWRLKDVTWKELKDLAVRFGLEELQAIAEQGLDSNN
ncbi:hypothetical protein BGW39_011192 [Mortierella sp. 14UC]|nr:hypothetical protein BGW39_011192 [Mortierella sp. 14UC]